MNFIKELINDIGDGFGRFFKSFIHRSAYQAKNEVYQDAKVLAKGAVASGANGIIDFFNNMLGTSINNVPESGSGRRAYNPNQFMSPEAQKEAERYRSQQNLGGMQSQDGGLLKSKAESPSLLGRLWGALTDGASGLLNSPMEKTRQSPAPVEEKSFNRPSGAENDEVSGTGKYFKAAQDMGPDAYSPNFNVQSGAAMKPPVGLDTSAPAANDEFEVKQAVNAPANNQAQRALTGWS